MQNYETDNIIVSLRYDIEYKKTTGEIYSKVEGEQKEHCVGSVVENPIGIPEVRILKKYNNRSYIKEDFEKLKPKIESYINMWRERASRDVY
ncbi:MAG: hypothetical protein HFJ41_00750 [Clostridia bacterium]|nr:hypothetical protein [Clostridia bacterium]